MLGWILAVGTGGAFTLAAFAFAAAWADWVRLDCGRVPGAGICGDATLTLVICALVGVAMLAVFTILVRRSRSRRDA